MPSATDFAARGKVTRVVDGKFSFRPAGTAYDLHLTGEPKSAALGNIVSVLVRLKARKVYTVPSGGNFVSPIFGPPKILQGRVKFVGEHEIVLHAGFPVVVELPGQDAAMDLNNGSIAVGSLVNVVAMSGATGELSVVALSAA